MKYDRASRRAVVAASALCCLIASPGLRAQATSGGGTGSTPNATSDEEAIQLSPFVVQSTEDQGYLAKDTLAGTRVRTDLKDVASSISVVTKQFMQDTGAVNNQTLLQYTTNTEVGGVWGNFSGIAGGQQYNEDANLLRPSNNTRVRGLDSADNTRDYFLTEIPWDGYNVDRVDMQRGPNSILFGIGSPAGIINTSINSAAFKDRNVLENRVSDYGSVRFSLDFNKVILSKELAIRVAALNDNQKYRQRPAYNHDRRVFGAIKFEPHLFGDSAHTSIRVNAESGKVDANRPRMAPPVDAITPWFFTGTDAAGNRNLNKFTYNLANQNPGSAPLSVGANKGIYPVAWLANGAVGRQFWSDVVGYYSDPNNGFPSFTNPSDPNYPKNNIPTGFREPYASTRNGIGTNGAIDNSIGGMLSVNRPVAIASWSSYFINSGIPGGGFYADHSLADPSIFDFYNKLLDGPNKHEWQKWNSQNAAVSQTFFNDRLGFEYVYDRQRYQDGQRVFLGNSDTYKIGIDIVDHLADGSPNPNVGRPFVANSTEAANSRNVTNRDGQRFTIFGDLRAEDKFGRDSTAAKILGHHVLTAVFSKDSREDYNEHWATSAATPEFTDFTNESPNLTSHFRSFDFVEYIGPSLLGLSSAANTHLSGVTALMQTPKNAQVTVFNDRWAKPTTPGAPGYVDPSAPFTYLPINAQNQPGIAPVVSTQSENPANYVGWQTMNVNMLNADEGDKAALLYDAQRRSFQDKSQGYTWQGHMFDDTVIPVFGWRKDKVRFASAAGVPDVNGIVNPNFSIPGSSAINVQGTSKSYGVMVHVPSKWTSFLPANTTISGFYNHSENFKADAPRGDIFGHVIPNQQGKTKEYGFIVSTLNDKLTFKATWYETRVANATLPGSNPLGQNSYFLWAVPVWGTSFVTNADQGIKGNNDNNSWAWNYAASDDANAPQFRNPDGSLNQAWQTHPSTVAEKKAIEAWRQLPLDQTFFNAYGNEVAIMNAAAIKSGDWTTADPIWSKKFDNQPISGGQLAGFGSGPTFTVDTLSKGQEFELYAQPTKNWNVSVNASHTFATRSALAPTIAKLISDMTTFLAGPAGDIRLWGGGSGNAMRAQWQNNILNPYQTFISQQGSNAPEIAPWRANAVTTYNFSEGRVKGLFVGGGYRWEQGRVLGYHYNPTTTYLNIGQPWKGPDDSHLDAWVGYKYRISHKIDWRIQLNVYSLGEKIKLVPVSINPDGTTAFSRIQEGMRWQLTNSFEF